MCEERVMSMAIEEASGGMEDGHGGPFGAVVIRGEEILAVAHNTVLKDKDPTRHAEITAISIAAKKCGTYDLSGCVIYSTTEPCSMCFSAIHWAKIDRLIYGTDIEDARRLGFNELMIPSARMKEEGRSTVDIRGGFMRRECEELLKRWESLPDKKVY
ncbi:MAG: nucleoside deaminase [Candidatus Omnitrophota bacterium]